MADDDDTIPVDQTPADAPTPSGSGEPATAPDAASDDSAGVRIPGWLAGALVVVLALLIAGAGFAIGRATGPDGDELRGPALIGRPGAEGRGPGMFPGGPGGPGGRGGSGGGERGPRFGPGGPPDEQGPQQPGSGGTSNGDTGSGGTGN